MTTVLQHNICVYIDGGENMTDEQINEAIEEENYSTLWVENPCLGEIISTAHADFDVASADTDVTPLTTEEKEVVRLGIPEVGEYS